MIKVSILNAGGKLSQYEGWLNEICDRAIDAIRQRLDIDDVDVVLQHNPSATIPEVGVCGYAPTAHLVQISLDPANQNFESSLEEAGKRLPLYMMISGLVRGSIVSPFASLDVSYRIVPDDLE